MEKTQIQAAIGKIGEAAAKLAKDVQSVAIEVTMHALTHGDVTLADNLVDALGKGLRRASLRAWFEVNGPFYLPRGKTSFALDKERAKKLRAIPEAELRETLAKNLWEEAKPEEAVVTVLDCTAKVDAFIKRMTAEIKAMSGGTVKDKDLVDTIAQAAAQWHRDHVVSETMQPVGKSAPVERQSPAKTDTNTIDVQARVVPAQTVQPTLHLQAGQ
jgi:hypothetical protein